MKKAIKCLGLLAGVAACLVSCSKEDVNPVPEGKTGTVGEAVDLGLPSGTLWADRNVGSTYAMGAGNFYAWGEVAPKKKYSRSTYFDIDTQTGGYAKYNAGCGKTELDIVDDVAAKAWGGDWRIPTKEQFAELAKECTWTDEDLGNALRGFRVEGPNGNSIFLPMAGSCTEGNWSGEEVTGCYWTRSFSPEVYDQAWVAFFYGGLTSPYSRVALRFTGYSVRPVCK